MGRPTYSAPLPRQAAESVDCVNSPRCTQLKIESEIVVVSGAGVELRVPIRRCLLGEQMARLLMQTEGGQLVCAHLLINSPMTRTTPGLGEAENENRSVRVAYGPDLEPIHPLECTIDRCMESCSPSYKTILLEFGLKEALEAQTKNSG